MKFYLLFTRITCIGILVAGAVWLLNQNIPFDGHKTIQYAFGDPGPIISELQPASRIGAQEYGANTRTFQKMYEDPLYFNLTTPVKYNHATMTVYYRNTTSIPLSIGIEGETTLDLNLYPLTNTKQEGEWSVAQVDMDLSHAQYWDGRYRFVISAPGLIRGNPERYIALSSIVVELERDPLSIASLSSALFQ